MTFKIKDGVLEAAYTKDIDITIPEEVIEIGTNAFKVDVFEEEY